MQDSSVYSQIKPQFPDQEHLKCPRCDSGNTKFCYYNNYNLSQPRHFCKNCRRYWTKGGALRNVPVGGGSRKNGRRSSNPKRNSSSSHSSYSSCSSSSSATTSYLAAQPQATRSEPKQEEGVDWDCQVLDGGGSFCSLLLGDGQFGHFLLGGLNPNGLEPKGRAGFGGSPNPDVGSGAIRTVPEKPSGSGTAVNSLGAENSGELSCWRGSNNGWPRLSNSPGSTFE